MDLEGGGGQGGRLAPQAKGAPPLGFPQTLGAWALGGRWRPAHLGAGSPPYSALRALQGRWTLPVDPWNPITGDPRNFPDGRNSTSHI